MGKSRVIGIDFGTSRSYFCSCPSDDLNTTSIDFGTGLDGLATAILYRDGSAPLVGDEAVQEWGDAMGGERSGYRLVTHFKPDIVASDSARQNAAEFLKAVLVLAKRLHVDVEGQFIFGVPAEAGRDFENALKEIAAEAGYGAVRTVPEPVGALLYHCVRRDLAPDETREGVLVVDFGGGTCDFAYMCRLEVRHSWGDMLLGGRLFDDLFFQWFLEQNPDAQDRLAREGGEHYVHWYLCRELKEYFSRTMARDRDETVHKDLGGYGRMEGMTWHDFMERSRRYAPSPSFAEELSAMGGNARRLTDSGEPLDLIEWLRTTLVKGLDEHHIRPGDVARVILSGGSSQWPFVIDMVCEVLHAKPEQVVRSDRPSVTVGDGLAMLPAAQSRYEKTIARLRRDIGPFLEKQVQPLVERRIDTTAQAISDAVSDKLLRGAIRPILVQFREEGGRLTDVKKAMAAEIEGFEPELCSTIRDQTTGLGRALSETVRELLTEWLAEAGIEYRPDRLSEGGLQLDEISVKPEVDVPDGYAAAVNALTAAITASISASICGGGGMALLTTGPLGLLLGAILGLVAAGLGLYFGRGKIRQFTERWPIPSGLKIPLLRDKSIPILRAILTDRKLSRVLDEAQRDLREHLGRSLSDALRAPKERILVTIREHVDEVIDGLAAIDRL